MPRPLLLAIATLVPFTQSAAADPPEVRVGDEVVVSLADGRTARGTLDAATDATRVVLGTAVPGIHVTSSFPRDRVLRVLDAKTYDASQAQNRIVVHFEPRPSFRPLPPELPVPRIRSLFIEARVANLDADAEPDGLVVHVVPRDARGYVVPVDGWLDANLVVERFHTNRKLPWRDRDRPFVEAERWGVRVRADDFGPDGAFVPLPFRSLRPERDLVVAPDALLRARFVVRGQGSFEAEDPHVRLRPTSRFRDELEKFTHRRGFPRPTIGRRSLTDDDR